MEKAILWTLGIIGFIALMVGLVFLLNSMEIINLGLTEPVLSMPTASSLHAGASSA